MVKVSWGSCCHDDGHIALSSGPHMAVITAFPLRGPAKGDAEHQKATAHAGPGTMQAAAARSLIV